jgi:hypothetical protein
VQLAKDEAAGWKPGTVDQDAGPRDAPSPPAAPIAQISTARPRAQPRGATPVSTTAEHTWVANWGVRVQGAGPRGADGSKRPPQLARESGRARGRTQQAAAASSPRPASSLPPARSTRHGKGAPRLAPRTDSYAGCRPELWEAFVDGEVQLRSGLSLVRYVVIFRPLGDGNCGQRAVIHDDGGLGYGRFTGEAAVAEDLAAALDLKLRGAMLMAEAMNKDHALVFKLAARDDRTVKVKGQTFSGLTRQQYLTRMAANGAYASSVVFMMMAALTQRPIIVIGVLKVKHIGTTEELKSLDVYNPCGTQGRGQGRPIWLALVMQESHIYLLSAPEGPLSEVLTRSDGSELEKEDQQAPPTTKPPGAQGSMDGEINILWQRVMGEPRIALAAPPAKRPGGGRETDG